MDDVEMAPEDDLDALLNKFNEEEADDGVGAFDVADEDLVGKRKTVWGYFCDFFELQKERGRTEMMEGHPRAATDLLDGDFPHIQYGTCAAFLLWLAGTMPSNVADVPCAISLKGYWYYFRQHYFLSRGGQSVPADVRTKKAIPSFLRSLIDEGLLTEQRKVRTIATAEGVRAIAFAAWQPEWSPNVLQRRWQTLFWQAAMLQGSLRVTSLIGDDDTQVATWDHFRLVIARVDNDAPNPEYQLGVLFRPITYKTKSAEGSFHVLNATAERWRCPVTTLLVLAALNDTLPEGFEFAMLDDLGKVLNGNEIKILPFSQPNRPVFLGHNPKRKMWDKTWALKGLGVVLRHLCELAEFDSHVVPSTYRTMGLQHMSISGIDMDKIQIKATHVYNSTVTDIYLRQLPPVDMAALTWGQSDRLREAYDLHPHTVHPGFGAARASKVDGTMPEELVHPTNEVEYIKLMQNMLFGAHALTGELLEQCSVALPDLNTVQAFCPKDSVTEDGQCASCGIDLEDTPGDILEHVLPCAGRAKLVADYEILLARYPAYPSLDLHPSLTFAPPLNDKNVQPKPTAVPRQALNPKLVWNEGQGHWTFCLPPLNTAIYTQLYKYDRFQCKCGHVSFSIGTARQHQLVHGLWITDLVKAARFVDSVPLPDKALNLVGKARYFWELGRWTTDPCDLEGVCEELYSDRFANVPDEVRYTVRWDVELSAEQRSALAVDLEPGYTDHSYDGRLCRSTPLRDKACFCCVHSTAEPFHIRMARPQAKHHEALHLCRELVRAEDAEGVFVGKSGLRCPDLVCRRKHRKMDNLLHLVWHLAAVHRVHVKKEVATRTTPLERLTLSNASELVLFMTTMRANAFSTTLAETKSTPFAGLNWSRALKAIDYRLDDNLEFDDIDSEFDVGGVTLPDLDYTWAWE